ncbi:DUF3891 family protein [Polycladomyces subterraneus]|uniref:DUF3891 family protein n=1 Tax=Polycladomyces subterraneus TaxID=1016997 RepID=A0ABT8IRI0_9BACL|nr:DUF3891 family protein [Polycladomyces subterraneus]MDN4595413.1 DUF3891 family protein [Polycladomyces subterraneus]
MIVRRQGEAFVLIRQHDHARISGLMARHWRNRPEPYPSVVYAIEYHDVGWQTLDHTIHWNETADAPYSFENFPLEPKLVTYREGIDRVEKRDRYAACLCSMHYASFFVDSDEPQALAFRERELERQKALMRHFSDEDRSRLKQNLHLLQVCDNLSLFLCFNQTGENTHPWYRDGVKLGPSHYHPVWESSHVLRLEPNPFDRSFVAEIPYQVVGRDRRPLSKGSLRIKIRGEERRGVGT